MRRLPKAFGLMLLGLVFLLACPATPAAAAAPAPGDDVCATEQLAKAQVTASVRLDHDGQDYSMAESVFVVKVPTSWKRSSNLLLNGDTEPYRAAMRCLFRDPATTVPYRDSEWRYRAPKISLDKAWVVVEYRASTWVNDLSERDFGPWRIEAGKRFWTLRLIHPRALAGSWWKEVEVDLGERAARSVSPAPAAGSAGLLTWTQTKAGHRPPEVRLLLQPPAAKAMAARWSTYPWYIYSAFAWMTWDFAVFAMLLATLWQLRRDAVSSLPTPAEEAARRNLLLWAWLLFAVMLAYALDDNLLNHLRQTLGSGDFWSQNRISIHLLLSTAMGGLMCLFGKPRLVATVSVLLSGAYITAVALTPETFALPHRFALDWESDPEGVDRLAATGGAYWLALACAALAFIWLVGVVSCALRLWRSFATPPAATSPGRFPHSVLGLLALFALFLPAAGLWAAENNWERISWLSTQKSDWNYGHRHTYDLFWDLAWFASDLPDWLGFTIWWWTTPIALLAVLRARSAAPHATVSAPSRTEWLVLRVFFVIGVAPVMGWYGGTPVPLISLFVFWLTLSGLLALGRWRSVLAQELVPGVPLLSVVKDGDRQRLIGSARRQRELHAQLRRLEQGQGDKERAAIERTLDRLHRWTPPHATHPHTRVPLPDSVRPVELALAWGPRATWLGNAGRAAFFASLFGLPATAVLFWADQVKGVLWADMFSARFGLAGFVEYVISQQIVWACAGFTLGALWRVLPGRRGPVRALGLSLTCALPVLVDRLGNVAFGQAVGTSTLWASLLLLVLSLSGVAMDVDTFRSEKHYWPTRAGLLLSLYQLRTASVQIAFFVAQVVALLSIWQQVRTGASPSPGPQPPEQMRGGGGSP
ncbi:DUF6185 family protein [Streptomyces sp. NPDC126933]|uniref:DUF6185 family protein n=1 Tax=unclassified Streptomyces TaxID=2593676 RepID=UPI003659557A